MSVIKEAALQGTKKVGKLSGLPDCPLSLANYFFSENTSFYLSEKENVSSSEQSHKHTIRWVAKPWSLATILQASMGMEQWANVDVQIRVHFLLSDRICLFACAKLFILSEKSSKQRKFPLFEVQNYNEATQSFCVSPINIVLFTSAICFFFNIPPFPMGIL